MGTVRTPEEVVATQPKPHRDDSNSPELRGIPATILDNAQPQGEVEANSADFA
jgi:hypothetical protein